MRKIGDGLQYITYDLGNGRVFKRTTTKTEKVAKLKSWNFETAKSIAEKIADIDRHAQLSITNIKTKLDKQIISPALFGNPVFEQGFNYTQDKIISIGEYVATHSLEQNKRVLSNYIKLVHKLWQYGIDDDTRKPTENNGVYYNGKVILIDFGECVFEKSKVASHIRKNNWLTQFTLKRLQDKQLQEFAIRLVANEVTLTKLNNLWKQKI